MMTLVFAAMGATITSFLGRLLWEEFASWHPSWCAALIRLALKLSPPELRERLAEEWQGYLDETPGYVRKIWNAAGFVVAARKLPRPKASPVRTNSSAVRNAFARASDLVFAAVILVLLAPCFIIITALIRLASPGPALYRRASKGRHGRRIMRIRFRTMELADDRKNGRYHAVGKFMRCTSLDELPAFINVLKGDLSVEDLFRIRRP